MRARGTPADAILPGRGAARRIPSGRVTRGEVPVRAKGRRAWLCLAVLAPGIAAIRHLLSPPALAPDLAVDLAALALLVSACLVLGAGLRAEAAPATRPDAPPLPLKTLAAVLAGAGVAAAFSGLGPWAMAVSGASALALHLVAFGTDPRQTAGAPRAADRTGPHLDLARKRLDEIGQTLRRLGDPDLTAAGRAFTAEAERLLALAAHRPAALPELREHLGVLLLGARDATLRLGDLGPGPARREARAEYLRFLSELKSSYAAKAGSLESAIRQDMNVEMDVVRDRLNRRGPLDSEE